MFSQSTKEHSHPLCMSVNFSKNLPPLSSSGLPMILEQSVLLTWLFFTHESSRDGLAEIQEQLKKELNCQVRYIEPRELGTITANPQTMETSAVLNLLLRFSCLKAHKTFGTRREAFLFASLCLNPLWIRPVLSASQCCDSRRNSDSHVAAREKLLCTQARASSLPDP